MATENDSRQSQKNERTESVKHEHVKPLPGTTPPAAITPQNLAGTGFTYRHDWGNLHGQWILNLNWNAITCNSRVFVSASEFGGGDQCDFTGAARYTVHNVSPHAGTVTVWVEVEWNSDIRLHVDYLVVNP